MQRKERKKLEMKGLDVKYGATLADGDEDKF
jgi:hypothetical protein